MLVGKVVVGHPQKDAARQQPQRHCQGRARFAVSLLYGSFLPRQQEGKGGRCQHDAAESQHHALEAIANRFDK